MRNKFKEHRAWRRTSPWRDPLRESGGKLPKRVGSPETHYSSRSACPEKACVLSRRPKSRYMEASLSDVNLGRIWGASSDAWKQRVSRTRLRIAQRRPTIPQIEIGLKRTCAWSGLLWLGLGVDSEPETWPAQHWKSEVSMDSVPVLALPVLFLLPLLRPNAPAPAVVESQSTCGPFFSQRIREVWNCLFQKKATCTQGGCGNKGPGQCRPKVRSSSTFPGAPNPQDDGKGGLSLSGPTKYSAKRRPWRFWRFWRFRRSWRFWSWRLPPSNSTPLFRHPGILWFKALP